MRLKGVLILAAIGLGLAMSASVPFFANQAALGLPQVVSLHPEPNTISATLTTDVSITYDQNIDPATVTTRTFAVHGMQSGLMTGTYIVSGGTIALTADRPLHAGELVRAIASAGILNLEGGEPVLPYQWQFNAGVVKERCMGGFTDINAGLTDVYAGSVAWGDYDNDGDLDILLTGCSIPWCDAYHSLIYRNDGPSLTSGWIFNDINAGLTGVVYGSAAWGDYDNDGDLDILLTGNSGSGSISLVYRNDDGIFVDINADLPDVSGPSAWGDYDNDGDLDILLTGFNSLTGDQIARVYRNDDGIFVDINAGLPDVSGSSAWGDYDNDGDLDILLTGYLGLGGIIARVYRNDSGSFSDINAGLPGVDGGSVAWGDYDNDGDLDILLTGDASQPILLEGSTESDGIISRVYRNDSGSFSDINAGLPGMRSSSANWGDYDNDGDLDILLIGSNYSGRISLVYRNDDGIFVDINADLPEVFGSAAWGDYDNDGDLDILLEGSTESDDIISRVYRNDDGPDLSVSKVAEVPAGSGNDVAAAPGEPLTYTLAFANMCETSAEGVVLIDTIPLGQVTNLTYTVSSGLSVTLRTGTTYIWDVEDLLLGEDGRITITGLIMDTLPDGLVFTNTASISTTSMDADQENNQSAVTVTIQDRSESGGSLFLPLVQR